MIDYVKQWFQVYRKLGEPCDIIFELNRSSEKPQLIYFPHENGDGISALYEISKVNKFNLSYSKPDTTLYPPTFLLYFWRCLEFLYITRANPKIRWPFQLRSDRSGSEIFKGLTIELSEYLRFGHLEKNLNSHFLYHLNKTVIEHFDLKEKSLRWWVPVNMRNDLGESNHTDNQPFNYVSNFTLELPRDVSKHEVRNLINLSLKLKRHWGTWWWQKLGRYTGQKLLTQLAEQNLKTVHYAGVFSNLGKWSCSDQDLNLKFFVNTLRSHPIGASLIIWNDQINIGLRVHPSWPLSENELDRFLIKWKENILARETV